MLERMSAVDPPPRLGADQFGMPSRTLTMRSPDAKLVATGGSSRCSNRVHSLLAALMG
jgi:hypothetical protein